MLMVDKTTEVIPEIWETRIKAFVLQEVRHMKRVGSECTSDHVQERMDDLFGTRYHETIWRLLVEAILIEQNQDQHQLAYILYQLGGQDEVYEAVNKGIVDHDKWDVCEPCDTNSPFLNNTCLVCGS